MSRKITAQTVQTLKKQWLSWGNTALTDETFNKVPPWKFLISLIDILSLNDNGTSMLIEVYRVNRQLSYLLESQLLDEKTNILQRSRIFSGKNQ